MSIRAKTYTREWATHNNIFYGKVSLTCSQAYIGMTTIGMHKRDLARDRKYKQLLRGRLVSCEPALRWWTSTKSYKHFMSIVLTNEPNQLQTITREQELILQIQPALNAPAIYKFYNHTADGQKLSFSMPKTKYRTSFRNMFKKARQYRSKHYPGWQTFSTCP